MGDDLPTVPLAVFGANVTVQSLFANSNACVLMSSDAATGQALKCWGPNGYGQLGLVSVVVT